MKLIGMPDSPYVRRVAISLKLLGIPFEHQALSVFSAFEQFRAINPLVKAPTLICDNGVVLIDSTLILDYVETAAGRSLMPAGLLQRQYDLRIIGLALAACEKTLQIMIERDQRPADRQYEPWLARVRGQLDAAWSALEAELQGWELQGSLTQADITTAVAWRFSQMMLPDLAAAMAAAYPALAAFSAAAERLPAFLAVPPVQGGDA